MVVVGLWWTVVVRNEACLAFRLAGLPCCLETMRIAFRYLKPRQASLETLPATTLLCSEERATALVKVEGFIFLSGSVMLRRSEAVAAQLYRAPRLPTIGDPGLGLTSLKLKL